MRSDQAASLGNILAHTYDVMVRIQCHTVKFVFYETRGMPSQDPEY